MPGSFDCVAEFAGTEAEAEGGAGAWEGTEPVGAVAVCAPRD